MNFKLAIFDTHSFERNVLDAANKQFNYTLTYFEPRLTEQTAELAEGQDGVCAFVNDVLNAKVLEILKDAGVRLIALRSAGFNNVDLIAAERLGLPVVRVPEYSPYAVAEHAVALMLSLNRKIPRAYSRVRDHNFSLEGLVGFDIHRKTVGIVGTGKIGTVVARIMRGFHCEILAYDINPNADLIERYGVEYVSLPELYKKSDIISLHIPLMPETFHMIDESTLAQMKPGAMLINTGRGALIDSKALLGALKSGHLGYAGLDVYEEEEGVFFRDLSEQVFLDDVLAILLTFPNVLITSHQAFLTNEALQNIAHTTLSNIHDFEQGKALVNQIHSKKHLQKVAPQ
jgi:D-lactate dehydrogenase